MHVLAIPGYGRRGIKWLVHYCYPVSSPGLVEDPMKEHKDNLRMNLWSEEEKEIFRDKYLQHPKNFQLIASFLERKVNNFLQMFTWEEKLAQIWRNQEERRFRYHFQLQREKTCTLDKLLKASGLICLYYVNMCEERLTNLLEFYEIDKVKMKSF